MEDVYATLVMANGAVMEGIETNVFFTFFGLDGITKKQMNHLSHRTPIHIIAAAIDIVAPTNQPHTN